MGDAAAWEMKVQQNMLYERTMASGCEQCDIGYQETEECIVYTAGMLKLHLTLHLWKLIWVMVMAAMLMNWRHSQSHKSQTAHTVLTNACCCA